MSVRFNTADVDGLKLFYREAGNRNNQTVLLLHGFPSASHMFRVWGKNDPFFIPPGAEAFRRDVPSAEIHFVDSGHFALETHAS